MRTAFQPSPLEPSALPRMSKAAASVAVLILTLLSMSCSSDTVRCRKVSATEFMRTHKYKGVPTDAFIGTAERMAFKKVHLLGLMDSWEILWTPVEELPAEYVRTAKVKETGFPVRRITRENVDGLFAPQN